MMRFGIGTAVAVGLLAVPGLADGNPAGGGTATAPEIRAVAAADTILRRGHVPRVRTSHLDRESMTITVYNQNFGLVREVRTVPVGVGPVEIEYGDVASAIQTETVHVRPLDGGFRILEQNYRYDLLSPQKLLEKYVGRTVNVYRYNPDAQREEAVAAEVIAVNNGTILRIGGEITFNYPGRIAFPELPNDLIAEPTLVWLADSRRERQRLEVSYLTNDLNWKADYVMVVNEDDTKADITGWVTLSNNSGATYENAQLKLVAGDVQRVQVGNQMREMARRAVAMDAVAESQFTEEGFFEYHLYTMARPTTVRNNEQKQVTLLEASDFGVKKRLTFYGAEYYYRSQYGEVASNQKLDVSLEFDNSERNRLGMPLPAGVVRVYKQDPSGAQQFIGEDRIDHTPRDERVRIRMGDAFDVVGDRRQMDWTTLGGCVSESTWEVELRNHKDEAVEVDVIEPIGGDWDILSSTHKAEKLDAHTFKFEVEVPARAGTTIEYRVRVRWC